MRICVFVTWTVSVHAANAAVCAERVSMVIGAFPFSATKCAARTVPCTMKGPVSSLRVPVVEMFPSRTATPALKVTPGVLSHVAGVQGCVTMDDGVVKKVEMTVP